MKIAAFSISRAARGLAAAALLLVATTPAHAVSIDTVAREAILIDMSTDTVLFEKNADQRMPTASMSKVATMYMVFDAVEQGRLSLDDTLPVSERAWRMQGSKMFVELGNQIKVEDLIRGVIIQSGNDACVVLAEGLAGTEEAFAANMTKRMHELGMNGTNLMNASGWPHPDHYSTPRDLATLAVRLIDDFPEHFHYYSETEFTYHGIRQMNRNPLLYRNMGVDGLKTGHTEEAGYGLIATGERDGRRLVLVVSGLPSMQARADESARLLEWGFRQFDAYSLFTAGETVDRLPVWLGDKNDVPLVLEKPLKLTLSKEQRRSLKVSVVGEAPLAAPVAQGSQVATLKVTAPELDLEIPLLAGEPVERLGLFGRINAAANYLVFGAP
ncbi:D-alanyl-D-alanine carboxypeptidase family protein [Indioceanicola profundi]|uniref:D-alanyl-D-alanine carboxypeptidase family protein n=1 Tax=Indioceanicola profundi TaxID=2220096 RepID=UPI001CEC8270|nr:D-alanyl-D-alanine carboxypeptidase family protein [Indioceanicola profundi]